MKEIQEIQGTEFNTTMGKANKPIPNLSPEEEGSIQPNLTLSREYGCTALLDPTVTHKGRVTAPPTLTITHKDEVTHPPVPTVPCKDGV